MVLSKSVFLGFCIQSNTETQSALFFENFGAQTSQVLDSDPHPLHVALDAGVVEDREGAGGERQVDHLQHQQT